MDVHSLDQVLLAGSVVMLLAIVAVRASVSVGLPSLLVYLGMGIALGESGLGIAFSDVTLAQVLGFAALIIILAEGGLTTSWAETRRAMPVGIALATIGLVISVGVVAVGAHYLLGMRWQLAVLLAAVLSPTDAAAIFSVLRRVPIPRRTRAVLEAESGLNDAPAVVIVTLMSATSATRDSGIAVVGTVVYELAVGLGLGLAVGLVAAWVLRRVALPSSGLYPLAVMTFIVFAYAGTVAIHASGFAAVFVAGVVLGNSELPHRAATRSFAEGLAWLAQIGLFIMLGLLASPGRLTWENLGTAVLAGVILTFVARPASVLATALPFRIPLRQQAFVSWGGLRGAVPIVLATIPLAAGVHGSTALFDVVFIIVVIFTLATGPTLPWVARWLGVSRADDLRELDVEAAPLERIAADLLQVQVSEESLLHGVEIGELRLPTGVSVSLIVRNGSSFTPVPTTSLR
ncbi:MAG: potassium/proton antiporter, partial [Nocardioidaceae bacterium]